MEDFNTIEDFNQPSPERIGLLNSLHQAIGDVPRYFWALCQVCDLQALENLIEHARISPGAVRIIAAHATDTIVRYWTQSNQGTSRTSTPSTTQIKRGLGSSPADSPSAKRQKTTGSPASSPLAERQTTTNSPTSSPLLHRSKIATALAKERDGCCCVLTSDKAIDVAHIYPFCRLSGSEENIFGARHIFWDHLRNFWSEEKVAAWETKIFPRGLSEIGEERVDNLITLSKTSHVHWNRGAFALKPISLCDNNTTLKVQFFWQKKQPGLQATISLCTTPLSTEGLDCNEGAFDDGQIKLFDYKKNKLIKSGDIFDLKTDDPIKKPLPNFSLLELQWALTRVVGMAGAAFPYEPTSGDDDWDDSDVPGLVLDKTSFISDLSNSPEVLHQVNRRLMESVKHYAEGAEGDRVVGVVKEM
ncbi:hypothetical protein EG329_012666 [Mollisiaceae sp. DMI_Dod_QoI]|nr:hypothetical protein EG329_012666 [Helotiales sp. DMI_Dod_QoI]